MGNKQTAEKMEYDQTVYKVYQLIRRFEDRWNHSK